MKLSRTGLCFVLLTTAIAPLGCEGSSSSSGGAPAADSGVFTVPDASVVDPPVPSECAAPTKGPTMHPGSINADETWTADGSPHVLPNDTTFYKTVTLEPCTELLLGRETTITIRDQGSLVAEGSASKRIHIGAKEAGQPFASIYSNGRPMRLAYVTIDSGGVPRAATTETAGTLDLQGDTALPTQELLFVDHVTIAGSASNGLQLRSNAGFTQGSNALVVKGAATHPISLFARSVGGIPVGAYTGNGKDQILLPATSNNETINETTTLHERGVPYLVGSSSSGGDLRVDVPQGQAPVTLTIEPGVTMRFKKGGVFQVATASSTTAARASLVAAGTADKPIVFTSDEPTPAAGDWLGLRFGDIPSPTNKLDHARVEYAGGTSSSGSGSCPDNAELMNDAAIRIKGWPTNQFVTNTVILASATNGIDRGWRDDREKIDFLETIAFTGVVLCNQTFPPNAANVCPAPDVVPCPKN